MAKTIIDHELSKFTIGADNQSAVNTTTPAVSIRMSYTANNDVEYVGMAAVGSNEADSVWSIRKFTYDVSFNLLSITYNDGKLSYTVDWTNRATHAYS